MQLTGPRNGIGTLKLITLIMAAMLLGGGSFFAWSKLRSADAESAGENAGEAVSKQIMTTETLSLGDFLVNVSSSDGSLRYLQTEISIVAVGTQSDSKNGSHAGDGVDAECETEEASLPPASHRYARDVVIRVLSSQSFEALRDQPDRSKLKALLQQELDEALLTHQVQDVLFTAFVMQ